jgi:protein arginine N-methyltransferase 5
MKTRYDAFINTRFLEIAYLGYSLLFLLSKIMTDAASLASCFTFDDISQASARTDGSDKTPVLKLISESHAKGYDFVCLPLTTPKWRERWRNMCIVPSASTDDTDENATAEQQAEAWRKAPSFLHEEVTISRLGKWDQRIMSSIVHPEWQYHR